MPNLAELEFLFDDVVATIRKKIRNGEATAADLSAAITLLKHNGIQAEVDGEGGLRELLANLPTYGDEDEGDSDDPLLGNSSG